MNLFHGLVLIVLFTGCRSAEAPQTLSYDAKMRRAEAAFQKQNFFEARAWVQSALEKKAGGKEAQDLMAKIIDREIVREKALLQEKPPEELTDPERKLLIKTGIERSRGFLELRQYDQAFLAAEEVFRLDPDNLEASRLMDEIKEKARAEGREESLFLRELYEEEIQTRIQHYRREAAWGIRENRLGMARLAIEKILLLDPTNREAHRLLAQLNEKEEALGEPFSPDFPLENEARKAL